MSGAFFLRRQIVFLRQFFGSFKSRRRYFLSFFGKGEGIGGRGNRKNMLNGGDHLFVFDDRNMRLFV